MELSNCSRYLDGLLMQLFCSFIFTQPLMGLGTNLSKVSDAVLTDRACSCLASSPPLTNRFPLGNLPRKKEEVCFRLLRPSPNEHHLFLGKSGYLALKSRSAFVPPASARSPCKNSSIKTVTRRRYSGNEAGNRFNTEKMLPTPIDPNAIL